jgi:4-amino-4-deoxy-L-arabinose transferase-like glycosyltransferase
MNTANELHSGQGTQGSERHWHSWRILILVLVVGLFVRVAITSHQGWNSVPRLTSDEGEFDSYAWSLAEGHGFSGISPDVYAPDGTSLVHRTAYRSPGTSAYWSILYRIFGHNYAVVRVSQCILDLATILVLYAIGFKCYGRKVALLTAAIYAVWPTALIYASQLASETQYTLLFCGAILLALRFTERTTWARALAAGFVLGLAMLTRGNAVLMVGLLMPWSVWQFRKKPRLMVRGLAISAVALLMLVPWTIRNYTIFHALIPFQTEGGDTLLGSHNRITAYDPDYYGYWIYPLPTLSEYSAQLKAPNNEYIRDRVETHIAVEWLRSHPETWWYFAESKFRRSWTPFLQPNAPLFFRAAMLASWGPIVLLFALGVIPSAVGFLKKGAPGWILHLGILHFVLTAEIFYGASRFRFPVEGLCIIIASATLVWGCERIRRRPSTPALSSV